MERRMHEAYVADDKTRIRSFYTDDSTFTYQTLVERC